MKKLRIFILPFAFLQACTFENEEDTYGDLCDTTSITYSQTIRPIFEQSCYSCHSVGNANTNGGGLDLQTYANLKDYLDGAQKYFISAIRREEFNGVSASQMPKDLPKLKICEIKKMEMWIADGYPEN